MEKETNRTTLSIAWWAVSLEEIKKLLQTNFESGLSSEEVFRRQKKYGRNTFRGSKKVSLVSLLLRQISSPLVIVLLSASFLTLALNQHSDAIVIFFALLINVSIGMYQERRAGKAFEKLAASQERSATVIRKGRSGGMRSLIQAKELVPGDIIFVEQGSYVPADARILEEMDLAVNESILTGEWTEAEKNMEGFTETDEGSLRKMFIEQPNMMWMGTLVVSGASKAVVVETGERTELGKIAREIALEKKDDKTPLEKNVAGLAQFLGKAVIISVIFIFLLGIIRGIPLSEMLLISIAIAVGIMPEGLPAAVTVILALGMEQILLRGGLVKKLSAAETLGGATVILTDKTGTLTRAEMQVESIITAETLAQDKAEKSYARKDWEKDRKKWESMHQSERDTLDMAVLASDAYVEHGGEGKGITGDWVVRGRPIERAVALAGLESGADQEKLFQEFPRMRFFPFQSKYRFSASLHKINEKKYRLFFLGSPEALFAHTPFIWHEKKPAVFRRDMKRKFETMQEEKAKEGMRLVGVAWKDLLFSDLPPDGEGIEKVFEGMIFAGLIALHDPLRPDAADAIAKAKSGGARVIMVTGDYAGTAEKIAADVGISQEGDLAMTGFDLEKMSDNELVRVLSKQHIFARVLPHQKLRIVQALRNEGEVVAMTGDGVNDAPALRHADIGIALGSGTEVAKEASGMVLLDDSFSVIVAAIEEGRRILDNIKKVVIYLLSTSWSEGVLVGAALIAGTPLPLLPGQILWANIVGEGFMNFAFAFEPAEKNIMQRNPRESSMKNILAKRAIFLITLVAVVTGVTLSVVYFTLVRYLHTSPEETRTLMFLVLSGSSLLFAFSLKDFHTPIWRTNLFSNTYLLFAFALSFAILALAFILPPLRILLSLTDVTAGQAGAMLGIGIINLVLVEVAKLWVFRSRKTK